MIGWNALALWAVTAMAADALPSMPPPDPALAQPAPPAAASVPSPAQVLALPDALVQRLRREVVAPSIGREARLQRLVEFAFRSDGLALVYDPDQTLTVAEAYASGKVNCLSFTLLFVAMARQIGLDATVQEVGQVASWYESRGLVYYAGHVNVGLRLHATRATLDLDSNVLYDRRGPLAVADSRAMAHFYNVRGVERMAVGDLAGAARYLQAAITMDRRFVSPWNNLGVLAVRRGQLTAAERAYQQALALDANHAATLSNAAVLYARTGNTTGARQLQARLQRTQRRDPFFQFVQAGRAERAGELAAAIGYYKHAIALYRSAHPFYFGLARAYYLNGQWRLAEREMAKARDLAQSEEARTRYQAKLDALARVRPRIALHH